MQRALANLDAVARSWEQVLEKLPAGSADAAVIPVAVSVMADGLLPVWLSEAADRWARVTGRDVPVPLEEDASALLGVKALAPPDMHLSVLIACMTHAAYEALSAEGVMVLDPLIARFLAKHSKAKSLSVPEFRSSTGPSLRR